MRHGAMAMGVRGAAWRMMLAAALLLGLAGIAAAAEPAAGITVQAGATAKGKATVVEIECALGGNAELAADATVKFRDAKKRALAAIAAMKNPDVSVKTEGLTVSTIQDNSRGQTDPKPHVQIWETSRIVLANADKLEPDALLDTVLKILDVAKDAGFTLSVGNNNDEGQYFGGRYRQQNVFNSGMVTYKLPDATALRDQAYKAALEDARAKAEKLAELAGVKLGKVLAIAEQPGEEIPTEEKAAAGNSTADLIAHVNLTVQFEIVK